MAILGIECEGNYSLWATEYFTNRSPSLHFLINRYSTILYKGNMLKVADELDKYLQSSECKLANLLGDDSAVDYETFIHICRAGSSFEILYR